MLPWSDPIPDRSIDRSIAVRHQINSDSSHLLSVWINFYFWQYTEYVKKMKYWNISNDDRPISRNSWKLCTSVSCLSLSFLKTLLCTSYSFASYSINNSCKHRIVHLTVNPSLFALLSLWRAAWLNIRLFFVHLGNRWDCFMTEPLRLNLSLFINDGQDEEKERTMSSLWAIFNVLEIRIVSSRLHSKIQTPKAKKMSKAI